jgi:hypothetical protein
MRGVLPNRSRTVAVSLVLALHALLVLIFHHSPRDRRSGAVPEPYPPMVFLPLLEEEPQVEEAPQEPGPVVPSRPRIDRDAPAAEAVSPEPITEPSPSPRDFSNKDWGEEARQAARTVIENRKKYKSLAAHTGGKKRDLSSKTKPEFAWKPRRVETADGVPYMHVGDRCVLMLFIIPACVLDKIEPRGDLFEHMKDVDVPEEIDDPEWDYADELDDRPGGESVNGAPPGER